MDQFEIEGSISKNDVPPNTGRRHRDYSALLRSVATLKKDEALKIKIDKRHVAAGIKRAIEREFKHNKFKITQRTNKRNGQLHAYILRES